MLLSLYTSYLFLCLYVCMLFMYVYVSLSDAMLLDKLNLSRTHMNSVIDQHIYQAERCSRRSCLRISSVPEIPEE